MDPVESVPNPQEWLTVKEIADELRLTPATIRAWIANGTLRAKRAGKRKWLVQRAELDEMLASTADPSVDEADEAKPFRHDEDILAPHHPRSGWSEDSKQYVRPNSWFGFTDAEWWTILQVSEMALPDEEFIERLKYIARIAARKASAIENLEEPPTSRYWKEQTGLPGGVLSRELSPEANRPGKAELWAEFDSAVARLDRTMGEHDLDGERIALGDVSVAVHDIIEDLQEGGYPWKESTSTRALIPGRRQLEDMVAKEREHRRDSQPDHPSES